MSDDRETRAARAERMRKEREKADRKQRNLITVGIVTVVVVLVAVGGYAISATDDGTPKVTDVIQPTGASDDYGIVYDAAAVGGSVPAGTTPVSVELYEDFQCPVCRQFEQLSADFLEQQVAAGAITITYRPFSFLDDNGGSPNDYSKRSTNVALCALDQGGVTDYVKVHDYLYAHQPEERTPGPEDDELAKAVKGLGLTGLDSCISTEKFVPWVKAAKAAVSARGVGQTPTVLVGGTQIDNPTPDNLQAAITAAAKA